MKIKGKKFNIQQPLGGVAGGVVAQLAEDQLPIDNSTAKTAIIAVVGAGLSAFTKSDLINGVGAGMLGLVGAKLFSNFTSDAPAASGLPSRNVMLGRASNWINQRRVSGSEMGVSNGIPASSKSIF